MIISFLVRISGSVWAVDDDRLFVFALRQSSTRSAVSRRRREKLRCSGSGFLDLGVEKSTAYKAQGATIVRVPAT
jgi:hypothetical protein